MASTGKQGRLKDVQDILRRTKKKYRDHENVDLQADIIEANSLACAGDTQQSEKRINTIEQQLEDATNKSARLMLDMARTYKSLGKHDKSQQVLEDLADAYADNPEICDAIDGLSEEPLSRRGKQRAVELNQKGKELFASKDYDKAVQLFGQALKHYPNNIGLNLNMMLALVREMAAGGASQPQLDRCAESMDKLAHLNADNPQFERYSVLCEHYRKLRASL